MNINSGQLADLRPGLGALDEAEPTDTMNPHLSIRVSGASYLYIVTIISRIHSTSMLESTSPVRRRTHITGLGPILRVHITCVHYVTFRNIPHSSMR